LNPDVTFCSSIRLQDTMRQLIRFVAAAALLAAAAPLAAQGPTTAARRAVAGLRGTVYDSLVTDQTLIGAEVFLEGTSAITRTDAKGNYAFTGLPAGKYVVGFGHPALDSLGITLPVREVELAAGTTAVLPLTTPSLRTIFPRVCNTPLTERSGLVIGRITDADADTAVAGAFVEAEWTAFILQRGVTPKNTVQTARAETDASGRYFLCGIPTDVAIAVRAGRDGKFGALVQIEMEGKGVLLRNLTISLGDLAEMKTSVPAPSVPGVTAARAPVPAVVRGSAMVAGVVLDATGSPVYGAEVRVIGTDAAPVKTSELGAYQLGGLPAGTSTVEVRALGYGPYRTLTELRRGRSTTVDLTLNKQAVQLAPVSVTGYSTLFDRSGFELRRKAGNGSFITEEDIRRRAAVRIEDVFRGIPSVQLIPVGLSGYAVTIPRAAGQAGVFAGSTCYPSYYVDGSLFVGLDPQVSGGLPIPPEDVRGIEVYASLSAAPPQYARLDSGCGIILVWTKRGAPNATFDRD